MGSDKHIQRFLVFAEVGDSWTTNSTIIVKTISHVQIIHIFRIENIKIYIRLSWNLEA